MLHILLFILKIIGIILAVILGILVLLVCIVLFVPVRYEVRGKCDGTLASLKGKVTITWFLHLIRADLYYKNQKSRWKLRIAWMKKNSGISIKEEENHEEKQKEAPEVFEGEKEIFETGEENREEPEESKKTCEESVEKIPKKESGYQETAKQSPEPETVGEKGTGIYEKIKSFLKKIKRFYDSIFDEVHIGAFRKVKKELFHLLKRLNPRKLTADIRYGFEDPCTTGQVLAGLSILYPMIAEHVNIIPDFEKRIFMGNIDIKGEIYGYYFLFLFWNLLWSKNVRITYRHIKNFEM